MNDVKEGKLQEIRKKTIPNLIEKYQKLINEIFDAASEKLPDFNDVVNSETNEVSVTAEMQLFSFIQTRKMALDNADLILLKVNELERELIDPNYKPESEEETLEKTDVKKPHPSKKHTRN
jgi:hypothetical protein